MMNGSSTLTSDTFRIAVLSSMLLLGALGVWQLVSTPSVGGRTQGFRESGSGSGVHAGLHHIKGAKPRFVRVER